MTADLATWLLARLDERERAALALQHADPDDGGYYACPAVHTEPYGDLPWGEAACDCGMPARRAWMLADVEAKRRIVELHEHERKEPDGTDEFGCWICSRVEDDPGYAMTGGWCLTLRLLALPYADRDDYLDEWKPPR